MNRVVTVYFMFIFAVGHIFAQSCYKYTRTEGIRCFSSKNFKHAKQVFNAAKSCPDKPQNNDLNYWIGRCDKAMNPRTQRAEIVFAQKMTRYEVDGEWTEDLLAISLKGERQNGDFCEYSVGFIDKGGNMVIPCLYRSAGCVPINSASYVNEFHEGMAKVSKIFGELILYGFIDHKGKEIIPFEFCNATKYSEGIAAVISIDDNDAYFDEEPSWHFINKDGNCVFSDKFYQTDVFTEGLCAIQTERTSGWGYINCEGELVIPCQYSFAGPFKDGVAAVRSEEHGYDMALINKKGEIISDYIFRPQYLEPHQITKAIEKEYKAKNYLKCYDMCKESESFLTDSDGHNAVNKIIEQCKIKLGKQK